MIIIIIISVISIIVLYYCFVCVLLLSLSLLLSLLGLKAFAGALPHRPAYANAFPRLCRSQFFVNANNNLAAGRAGLEVAPIHRLLAHVLCWSAIHTRQTLGLMFAIATSMPLLDLLIARGFLSRKIMSQPEERVIMYHKPNFAIVLSLQLLSLSLSLASLVLTFTAKRSTVTRPSPPAPAVR